MERKRQPAIKIRVADILDSEFVKRDGWEPSVILTKGGEVSRVNLMGFAVSKESSNIIIDDGTGNVSVRFFDEKIPEIEIGKMYSVIGRVRKFNDSAYIVPEIVRKTENPLWFKVWQRVCVGSLAKPAEQQQKQKTIPSGRPNNLIDLIRELDQGTGAEIDEVLSKSGIADAEHLLDGLIADGEVYKIGPSRVKLLD